MLFIIGVIFLASFIGSSNTGGIRRVCYFTNWSQYRSKPGRFVPEDIDPTLCTHIIYAFADLKGNHLKAREWNDESTPNMEGLYSRVNKHKQTNPKLKTLLAVGGWSAGSKGFSSMVATAASRKEFIISTIRFLRSRNFDGLDFDWEYPATRGSPLSDKAKFASLVMETRIEFDNEAKKTGKARLLLTAAVSPDKTKIDNGYDVHKLAQYLDFITVMSYDLHGSWEHVTGHNSPLFPSSTETGSSRHLNMAWSVSYWTLAKGTPKNKLNVGLALYGRSFKLSSTQNTGLGAPISGPGTWGAYTKEAGFLAFYEICTMDNSAKVHWIDDQKVPYKVKGDQWIGYDNEQSLTNKAKWVKQGGYGGISVWSIALDDFSGICGIKYPLMKAIKAGLQ